MVFRKFSEVGSVRQLARLLQRRGSTPVASTVPRPPCSGVRRATMRSSAADQSGLRRPMFGRTGSRVGSEADAVIHGSRVSGRWEVLMIPPRLYPWEEYDATRRLSRATPA
jgi:hypothetical protein